MRCKNWKICPYYKKCVTCNSDSDARRYCGQYEAQKYKKGVKIW